jgi:hypothetical protein
MECLGYEIKTDTVISTGVFLYDGNKEKWITETNVSSYENPEGTV